MATYGDPVKQDILEELEYLREKHRLTLLQFLAIVLEVLAYMAK